MKKNTKKQKKLPKKITKSPTGKSKKSASKKVNNIQKKASSKKVINKTAKKVIKKIAKKAPKKITKSTKPDLKIKKTTKKKKSSKTRYSIKELQHFKNILLDEKRKILESARANMRSLVDSESGDYVGDDLSYATHMAEQGTDEMEREKNYMFVQRDEKYLGYIEEALTRIDQGTYGLCIDCIEEPKYLCSTCPLIPKERLELVPITQHCIECKNLRG